MNHQGPIAGIAAAGRYVATAGYDNRLILWDAETRRPIARGLHDHLINQCAFNGDGTLIATASSDYSARLWEVPSLRLKAALVGHEDDVDMAVFSPDGTLVATCALDRKIRIFDIAGHCLKVLTGHTGNILTIAWSSDGERLVSSGVDGTVREWNARSGQQIRCTKIAVRTDTLEIDRNGRILAGDDDGRIVIIIDGQMSFTQAHQAGIKKLVYDDARDLLVTLSYDRTIAVWDLAGDRDVTERARTELPVMAWARAAVLIGPAQVAVGTFGSTFCVYDCDEDSWDTSGIAVGPGVNAVTVAGDAVFAVGDAGCLSRDGEIVARLGSLCNFLLPVGERLLSGGQLGRLFDCHSGEILYQHHSPLNCGTRFVRDGTPHVIIGSYTGEALVFAIEPDGAVRLVTCLKIYDNAIKGLAATDDQIFSVCASTDVAWHGIEDFRLLRLVRGAHARIANGCCRAGPAGFASIGRDLMLRVWDSSGDAVYQTPHPNSVKCICASDDRMTLMTGAYTGTVAGFDLATRRWTSFARPTSAGISSLAYHGGKRQFLASSYDGKVFEIA